MHKTLLITALLAAPLAAAQAHDDAARHRAWIAAQKIDIQPTLTVKETQVPADSANQGSSTYQQAPSGGMNTQNPSGMPSSNVQPGTYGSGPATTPEPYPGGQPGMPSDGSHMQGGSQMK